MSDTSNQEKQTVRVWPMVSRVMRIAGRDRILFYGAVLAVLARTGFFLWFNQSMRGVIDHALARQIPGFVSSAWQMLLALALLAPGALAQSYFAGAFSERTLARLRQAVAEHVVAIPVDAFQERHTGDLMSATINDINALRTLTTTDLVEIVNQIFSAVTAIIFLTTMSWKLALASIVAIPLMYVAMNRAIGPIASRAAELQDEVGRVTSIAQDGLAGLMVTRAFGLERKMDERLATANMNVFQKAARVVRLRVISNSLSNGVPVLPSLITFGYGGYLAITGQMSPGSLVAFVNLLDLISNPLSAVPRLYSNLGVAAGSAARVFTLIDQPEERTDGSVREPAANAKAAVAFTNVGFGYVPGTSVLTDVTFAVAPGETVAVVGPSGSGKSTLLRLLLGFYKPSAGDIELFGHDLSSWSLSDARRQMSLVAQDTYLFPVTLGENIAYGRPGATEDEIEHAARLANIHEFIAGLPDGYQTVVGERGARLSGGQRQRIAIARAILKDAPLLLLDEATSALDTESEALVQEALERFMGGRTTLVIAHRLSTIINADRVVVIDHGRVVEEGTHQQLLAANGLYRRLYLKQFAEHETLARAGDGSVAGGGRA